MPNQLNLKQEATKLPYDSKKNYLLTQEETTIHKLLCSLINRLNTDFSAEITHGRDEHGRDLVVKHRDALGQQYIGVIVKMGDKKGKLTGKTDGLIDQVISQSKQSLAHPCILHELSAGSVRINQLWIFFVGPLTNTASERIEYELKDVSKRIFALEEIINLFSINYPQVFFNPTLTKFVEDNLAKIEEIDKTGVLNRHYSTPWVSKWDKAGDLTPGIMVNLMSANKMPFTKLVDIITSGQKIILTGDPGSGKTTALVKIASDMFKSNFLTKSQNPDIPLNVPILIQAKDLVNKTIDDLYNEFVVDVELDKDIKIKTLLVDGLDDIVSEKRQECLDKASRFADKQKCGLVISCRKTPMLSTILSPFDRYELLPFDLNQAISFVEKSLTDQKLIEVLKTGIRQNELKIELTPMALELLIDVAQYEKEIPASLAEIFERYTDITCGKYDNSKGIVSVFEHHIKKRFLAELAWNEFYTKDLLEITKTSFDKFVNDYAEKYGWDKPKFSQFITEIERSCLLILDDRVSFSHRSFLDFFVASRISINKVKIPDLNKEIVRIYFNDLWSDVSFYYIGIERELDPEVITGIKEFPAETLDISVYKLLIGRLLQAGWHTPSQEKIRAIEVGLDNIDGVRHFVDKMLSQSPNKLPMIFSDFFYMSLSEQSFGSRTMLNETTGICHKLVSQTDLNSMKECLLLVWAQRSRLDQKTKDEIAKQSVARMIELEGAGELSVRDKFTILIMLEQVEKDNKAIWTSIRRKIDRTKEVYPADTQLLLPHKKGTYRIFVAKERHRH
jgi:hypothetical protein